MRSRLRSYEPRAVLRFSLLLAACLMAIAVPEQAAGFKTEIGYDQLLAEYPNATPNGAGVPVTQIEASATGSDANNNFFLPNVNDGEFVNATIVNGSLGSSLAKGPGVSPHATDIGQHFYGAVQSLANGVTNVTVYQADDYLYNKLLLQPALAGAPNEPSYRVANHSYVGSIPNASGGVDTAANLELLRRYDYLIDAFEVLSAVGTKNGSTTSHPNLLSHTYNALTVGVTDGDHSRGQTTFSSYGVGRIKPDVVVPVSSTSRATAVTSSALAMLYQSATDTANFSDGNQQAGLPETMRAIILAGATKEEFSGWENSAVTQPLDLVYGAGELNVYNSYQIQQGGQWEGSVTQGSSTSAAYGWDYSEISEDSSLFYELEVPQFYVGGDLSIALSWNVEVIDTFSGNQFVPEEHLADFDLFVYDSTGSPLGSLLASSESTVDNVEHVWLTGLSVGNYTVEVRYNDEPLDPDSQTNPDPFGGATRDFGLAWRLDLEAPYRATGDYNEDGVVDAGDYAIWRQSLGSDIDLAADGNLNGVVDQADYDIWRAAYGAQTQTPVNTNLANAATPEPSAALLLATLLGLFPRRRR